MKKSTPFLILCILIMSGIARAQSPENLDEMFARKARISGGNYVYNVSLLENSSYS